MIKLIVSDLDGTLLLHDDRKPRPEDIQALKEAIESGIIVAFASGRMRPEILQVMEETGIHGHCISQNGAYVHQADGTLLSSSAFEKELITELASAAEGTPYLTVLAAPEQYVVKEWNEAAENLKPRLMAPFVEIPDLLEQLGGELVCGKISYMGELEGLTKMQEELQERFGDVIDVYIADTDCLDVMPRTTSKGIGLASLLEMLDLRPEEAACFGDSFNDLPLFEGTPHSFAMGSSHPEVQAKAAHTVPYIADAWKWIQEYNEKEAAQTASPS